MENLKNERTLRTFIGRGINCGHAVLKNTAVILNVELPVFSTMVGTADLYNNNKLFLECFEKMTDLENTREVLKLKLENLYSLEYEEKAKINQTAKATTKTEVVINEIELSEFRKLKREKKEQRELHRMEFQQSLRKRFEI